MTRWSYRIQFDDRVCMDRITTIITRSQCFRINVQSSESMILSLAAPNVCIALFPIHSFHRRSPHHSRIVIPCTGTLVRCEIVFICYYCIGNKSEMFVFLTFLILMARSTMAIATAAHITPNIDNQLHTMIPILNGTSRW